MRILSSFFSTFLTTTKCYSNYCLREVLVIVITCEVLIKMQPRAPSSSLSVGVRRATVRQTIFETLEAPRLTGFATADFINFKPKREIYERRVQETSAEQGTEIPATSYRNFIEKPILQIFITAQWVAVNEVEEISEQHLKNCVEERSNVKSEDFDLAKIESGFKNVKLDKSKNLEMQVWKLGIRYPSTLDNLGYSTFIQSQPEVAVEHIMKSITHENLS